MAASDIANWVTADQVRAYAEQVNAQVEGVKADMSAGLAETGDIDAPIFSAQDAFAIFVNAWAKEHAQALTNSWLTFGLPAEAARIGEYQTQARTWQDRIAKFRGKPSESPTIEPPKTSDTSPLVWVGAGAVGILFLLALVRR